MIKNCTRSRCTAGPRRTASLNGDTIVVFMTEKAKYVTGYVLGISVFIGLIPALFIIAARVGASILPTTLITSLGLRVTIAGTLLLVGLFFVVWSNVFLVLVGKGGPTEGFGVSISPKTKKLVTSGPYRLCRNPMVFGAFLVYLSVTIFVNSLFTLLLLALLLIPTICYLKLSEEKRMERDFGSAFEDYRKRVPMLIPYKLQTSSRQRPNDEDS